MTPQSVKDALLDVEMLRRVDGRRLRSGVEFEDQCALRSPRFKGLWKLDADGRVRVEPAAPRAIAVLALLGEDR